jgi:hypothetical protein
MMVYADSRSELADTFDRDERPNGGVQARNEVLMRRHAQRAMKVALCHALRVQKTTF